MDIKICCNISKYRKENGVTQAELAEYLGVSPQAVSKWEQEQSTPDIYLIPKIALFFNISIDTLFGTSEFDATALLVSKYSIIRNDTNYKAAKESIGTLLDKDTDNLQALSLLCRLEYQRSNEYLLKSRDVCEKMKVLATEKDKGWEKRATVQLIRTDAMIGNYMFLYQFQQQYEAHKTVDNLYNLLLALSLSNQHQLQETLSIGKTNIELYSPDDQVVLYPLLMDLAYSVGDVKYVYQCFDKIIEQTDDIPQIFNAWWLLWKTHVKVGNNKESERCKTELLKLLPNQNYNEYEYEKILKHLEGQEDMLESIL